MTIAAYSKKKTVAIVATGWLGDTIACTAAATSLHEKGYTVTFFTRWPQLLDILRNDGRYKVVLYWHLRLRLFLKYFLPLLFDKVIWEPAKWSYQEPFTSEIRRIAGCKASPEYQVFLSADRSRPLVNRGSRPVISIARDLYKRAYGRDVDDLIGKLQGIAQIRWVGLSSHKNSKHGKSQNLLHDAELISKSDIFIGPEGGLLWLAAGIGTPCIYFTENIVEVEKQNKIKNLNEVLGSKNHFPDKSIYIALPPYCENSEAFKVIQSALSQYSV